MNKCNTVIFLATTIIIICSLSALNLTWYTIPLLNYCSINPHDKVNPYTQLIMELNSVL